MDAQQAAAVQKARASKAAKDGRTAVTLPPTRREAMLKECQTAYAFDEEEEEKRPRATPIAGRSLWWEGCTPRMHSGNRRERAFKRISLRNFEH